MDIQATMFTIWNHGYNLKITNGENITMIILRKCLARHLQELLKY